MPSRDGGPAVALMAGIYGIVGVRGTGRAALRRFGVASLRLGG
jgi:hypothetical protein